MNATEAVPEVTVAPDDPRVIAAVEEYLAALESGYPAHRAAFLERHAPIANALAECLDGLEIMHHGSPCLVPPRCRDGETNKLAEALEEAPLGDYRILREIGRGGMGIVFVAEQLSLARRVALKVLPFAAALEAKQLQRFRNEAHAAAQLRHEHIVPVFAVGCERGVHFYVMQYIDGWPISAVLRALRRRVGHSASADLVVGSETPLADLVPDLDPAFRPPAPKAPGDPDDRDDTVWLPAESNRTPAYFRAVATLGIQAAEALEHAHQLGVVHRDVKPANLLVDRRGHVWITDFGLARFTSATGVTQPGDVVGTLRYMSPEQALGDARLVDFRTDLYSLGATLYELLTLEPALDGRVQQELLRQHGDRDPIPLRRHNPAVPIDLQTIVLKALAKNPADRYATAQDFADDLRRFLDDKPIQARPPQLKQRIRRWGRRHRHLVAASLALLVVAMAGLALGAVLLWREEDRTEAALREARIHLLEAKWQRQRARQAVNEMYSQFAERWLEQEPRLEKVQLDFLQKALAYYQEFAREGGVDPTRKLEAAMASRRVGDIQSKLRQHDEAEDAYAQAIQTLQPLTQAERCDPEIRHELARCYHNRANLLGHLGRAEAAEQGYKDSLDLLWQLVREFPANRTFLINYLASQNNLGPLLLQRGRPQDAESLWLHGLDQLDFLVRSYPDVGEYRAQLAAQLLNLGNAVREQGKFDEAERAYRRCIRLLEEQVRSVPRDPVQREMLGHAQTSFGLMLKRVGRSEEAESALRQALARYEELARDFPSIPDRTREAALGHSNLSVVLRKLNKLDEAEHAAQRSVQSFRKLTDDYPAVPQYRQDLAAALVNQAAVLEDRDCVRAAEQLYRESLQRSEALAKEFTCEPAHRHNVARCRNNLGMLFRREKRYPEAEAEFREGLVVYAELTQRYPTVEEYWFEHSGCHVNLARLLLAMGRNQEAQEAFEEAGRIQGRRRGESSRVPKEDG